MDNLELVEVSFEVANKVGGIYQVLKSKSCKMQEYHGDGYLTVGYYDEDSAREDFAPRENPYNEVFETLRQEGIECYYGVWDIDSKPKTILVDPSGLEKNLDDLKQEYWEKYGVDSIDAGPDFNEPLKWGYSVARLIQELEKENEFVAHLHEWLSAGPIFHVESPTVFTTHATVLGRALSNSEYDLMNMVDKKSVDQGLEDDLGVKEKHTFEKAAAEQSDVFTTVSEITGREAEQVIGVKPDKILPNGFNIEDYPSLEELSVNHTEQKEEVIDFLRAYFEPYYSVDLDNDPRIFFTSGRYEYHNKGFDVLIDALAEVNDRPGDEIFFFFFVPSGVKGPNMEVLENKSLYRELEGFVDEKIVDIRESMLDAVTSNQDPVDAVSEILDSRELESLKSNFHSKKGGRPPMNAFDLNYEGDDILEALKENGLENKESDRVKIVFYPTYLEFGDKLLSMDYEEAVVASSAGFFPSYYEPWGYTPVETAANGALALTTDLAGFGRYLQDNVDSNDRKGIKVLERQDKDREQVIEQLALTIEDFAEYNKTEITERKHNARKLAQLTSWENLGENYRDAHKMAEKKR
ncbi:MAG: glycogen/starch synthase [Candidatus Nanohaloarchaea archaeon]